MTNEELQIKIKRTGSNIYKFRTALKISVKSLAFELGISEKRMRNVTYGNAELKLSELLILSDYLGVTLDDLVN